MTGLRDALAAGNPFMETSYLNLVQRGDIMGL